MTNDIEAEPKLMAAGDLPAALGLLTRLPVTVDTAQAMARGARAAWAFPLAGLVIGCIVALTGQVALWLSLPAALAAAIGLATGVVITGAMHEDGLADSLDGLWGGWDVARRLEIMKDSRIGAYGVIGLVLSLLIRWIALTELIGAGLIWPAMICVAMASRVPMVWLMVLMPPARPGGLSRSMGRPGSMTALCASGIALLAALVLSGPVALLLLLVLVTMTCACAAIAQRKIGGQTGDILGATQQVAEIAALLTLVVLLV